MKNFSSFAAVLLASSVFATNLYAAEEAPDHNDPVAMKALEQAGAMPASTFFKEDTAPRKEGALIRTEVVSGYELPAGAKTTRILYRSRDVNGKPTTASAVVVEPAGKAPAGGWPLVVWAHGTTGVARQCGPSVTKELGYYTQQLMTGDFAVLVIDYAGMSTEGAGHQYMTKTSNAVDVINAVPAAQVAVKSLSRKWVAIGHSQGGQAVWGVAELEAKRKDANYLGGIALAPAVGAAALVDNVANTDGETFYPVYFARAIKLQFPDFDINKMLTPAAAAKYDEITTQGCYYLASATFSKIPAGSIVRPGWQDLPEAKKFIEMNKVGNAPVKGPLFIAAGDTDRAVPPALVRNDATRQCKAGGQVFFKSYPGNHGTMMESSYRDQIDWIKARFAGKPAEQNCQ